MDDNLNNNTENNQQGTDNTNPEFDRERVSNATEMKIENEQNNSVDINSFSMDDKGNIRSARNGAVAIAASAKTYIILGWVSAAFTAFISPYFAVPGIVFGILANRQVRGRGNAIIITNVVLAAVNLFFGLFLIVAMRKMMFGY